jgi:hypothetical protein
MEILPLDEQEGIEHNPNARYRSRLATPSGQKDPQR